jgi:acyl CoA:acetate/3-ketoacid CoA transferase
MLSFLEVGADGSVNVSRLASRPHVTAGCGGFVDITAHARKLVFSGYFRAAGLELDVARGKVKIRKEGKIPKFVSQVDHVTFSGRRAREQRQDVTYVTERCVIRGFDDGLTVTEVAPGVDLEREVLAQAGFPLRVASDAKTMDERLFREEKMGLELQPRRRPR